MDTPYKVGMVPSAALAPATVASENSDLEVVLRHPQRPAVAPCGRFLQDREASPACRRPAHPDRHRDPIDSDVTAPPGSYQNDHFPPRPAPPSSATAATRFDSSNG